MKEIASAVAENKNHFPESKQNDTKSVSNEYGQVQYDYLKGDETKNSIFFFPGFPLGTVASRPFEESLNDHGRTVIAPNRIRLEANKIRATFDKEAELIAQIIEQEGLQDTPLDAVAHSNGALLFERVANIADERGWSCFREELGSNSVLIAPSGTNSEEKIRKFLPRYLKLFQVSAPRDKVLDREKRVLKDNTRVITGNLRKTAGEVRPILTKKIDYEKLGKIASRPAIVQYPSDPLYPYDIMAKTLFPDGLNSDNGIAGPVSTPVKLDSGLGKSLEEFAGNRPSDDDKERYYRLSHTANHADLIFNPDTTAVGVLQILDGPQARLERLRAANNQKQ